MQSVYHTPLVGTTYLGVIIAITQFVPEIWSAELLRNLRNTLVYANLANRNYEGDIARAGDTVHITSFADPAIRAYTKDGTITWDLLTDATRALLIDQANYFAFSVDDIDKRQALSGFVAETTLGAAYNLASAADVFVGAAMVTAANATANDLGAVAVTTPDTAYQLLVNLRTKLTRSNTPASGRWVVVPPELYGVLLRDDRFIRMDASGTTEGLRNGIVGRAAGFDVIESNVVPVAAGVYSVLAGHEWATTYAQNILETESIRRENTFGDGVRGLHVYGAKVIRPAQLALADVTITP